jgi:hypothetical protein
MDKLKDISNERIKAYFNEMRSLWPAVKGSITEVRKPCIRPNCKACKSGEKHPAFIFSFMKEGRQRCRYVAREFVPVLEKAVKNGKRIEELMSRLGDELIQDYRRRRDKGGPK